MEDLNPTWKVLRSIIYELQCGNSVKKSTHEACHFLENDFEQELFQWIHAPTQSHPPQNRTHHQAVLIQTLSDGLKGAPILETLIHLELEVRQSCQRELESHVARLPFLGMIPLMFFIGPAFFLLLIGPIMSELIGELAK